MWQSCWLMIVAMAYFWPHAAAIRKSQEETYPAGVLPFLKAHPLQGNMVNYYLWGGYLEWNDPAVKVFIDSRVDIFEYAGVLQDYLDLLGSDSLVRRLDPVMQKYNVRYVLFPPGDSSNPLLREAGLFICCSMIRTGRSRIRTRFACSWNARELELKRR